MYFPDLEGRPAKELAPGVQARTFWGDKMLMAVVDLAPGAVVPPHHHPHEQSGVVIAGEVEFTIGGETKVLRAGDAYLIPGDVPHGVTTGPAGAKVMDIFSPVREEYKY